MKTLLITSRTGCLLPFLIFFNLFFGWLFFTPQVWLAAEGVLILLFLLNSYILLRGVSRMSQNSRPARNGAIDVEGKVED